MVMPNMNLGSQGTPDNQAAFMRALQQQLQAQQQQPTPDDVADQPLGDQLLQQNQQIADTPDDAVDTTDLNSLFANQNQAQQAQMQQQQMYQQMLAQQQMAYQQLQATQSQNDQLQDALFINFLEQNVANDDDKQTQWDAYQEKKQLYNQMQQQQTALQIYQDYMRQMETAITPLIREQLINQASQKAKVPKAILQMARTPQELQMVINVYNQLNKTNNLQKRKEQGTDRVADSSGQAPSGTAQTTFDEIKKHFSGTNDIEGYLRAQRKARAGQPWK